MICTICFFPVPSASACRKSLPGQGDHAIRASFDKAEVLPLLANNGVTRLFLFGPKRCRPTAVPIPGT
jgi:hypothetical protein